MKRRWQLPDRAPGCAVPVEHLLHGLAACGVAQEGVEQFVRARRRQAVKAVMALVWVDSALGHCSTSTFTLPVRGVE